MKTIVSDLDGTLLNSYGVVDPFTKDVLNTSPIYRIIATGRSYKTASPLLKGVDIDYYVLLNGAECRNSQGDILYKENINLKIAHTIMCEKFPLYAQNLFCQPQQCLVALPNALADPFSLPDFPSM